MKKITLLLLICLLTVSIIYAKPHERLLKSERTGSQTRAERPLTGLNQEIVWNFDDHDISTWEHGDLTVLEQAQADEFWKLVDHDDLAIIPADTGYYWWPGIISLGGYISARILYLQTPDITLPASPGPLTFSFKQYYESPGAYQDYNGWDGWHVRISTNNWETWTTLTPTSPAYNATSVYGFGYNGEGPGHPGWCGQSTSASHFPGTSTTGFINATLPLTAYANQTVSIRFVHGADPAWDTAGTGENGNPNAFGVIVNNIAINGTAYNFTDPTNFNNFTRGTLIYPSNIDLWQLRSGFEYAASEPNVLTPAAQTAGVWSYQYNMANYITSPIITLPADSDVWVDFKYTGFFQMSGDADDDPYDGITWEIYHNLNGSYRWYTMKYPYDDGRTAHLTFTSNQEQVDEAMDWFGEPEVSTYSWAIDGDISQLSGRDVRFRWVAMTNIDPAIPGKSIKLDNFTVFNRIILQPITELSAEVNAQNQVVVTWTDPEMAAVTLEGVKVQRKGSADANYTTISTVNPGVGTFTDTNPPLGTITNYQLVPVWFPGDGPGSRVLKVVAPSSNQRLLSVDNGIAAEIALPTAAGATFANKITRAVPWEKFYIKYVMVYITEQGSAASYFELYRLHEDGSGRPGSRTINTQTYIHQDTVLGWYIFEVPESANSLYETDFWVSYRTLNSNSPKVGISEVAGPTVAMWGTFTGTNLSYNNYDAGNFMIRVIVEDDPLSDGDNTEKTPAVLSARNYPNPFNPSTTISFNLPKTGKTSLQVYNIKGQLVNTLLNEEMVAGTHNVNWNGVDSHGNSVSSGIYFYKVDNAGDSIVNKMILMK